MTRAYSQTQRLVSEALGTGFLLASIVGSGIMAQNLGPDASVALQLLCNSIATGAMLVVLITILGPISGAHFNPAVTLVFLLRGEIQLVPAVLFVAAQIAGGVLGVLACNVMFSLDAVQVSQTVRGGAGQLLSEFIATFGLLMTILLALRARPEAIPMCVGLYVASAIWFTSSTSFANPAVTIARVFSDTFAGIEPGSVAVFIALQIAGAGAALGVCAFLSEPAGEGLPIEGKLAPEPDDR